ncbi:MAG TPA: Maf family protein [Anaerolineales bacterium]|nr:Maf family protein [Anaerolineales bacterium]
MTKRTLLLLASNSPRRRELLSLGSWMFSVSASNVDETQRSGEAPAEYVLRLAEAKARAASRDVRPPHVIIGADTAVVDETRILGKPRDRLEATAMLKSLRGYPHRVYTALAVLRIPDERLVTDLCVTRVPMRNYSDEEIEAYVRSGDPLDKAGAYGIQHRKFHPVAAMTGCYASVMGLPLCHLVRILNKMNVHPRADIPAACQSLLQYQCPVSSAILRGEQAG